MIYRKRDSFTLSVDYFYSLQDCYDDFILIVYLRCELNVYCFSQLVLSINYRVYILHVILSLKSVILLCLMLYC